MKRVVKSALAFFLGITISTTTLSADVKRGGELYSSKLESKCKKSGSEFAAKHSQNEWENIYDAGKLGSEIKKICYGNTLGEKLLPHIYDFAYHYANDSGNITKR